MRKRQYVDPDVKAIALTGFQPNALSLSILQVIFESTQLPCFLIGGALRSQFMKTAIQDYDVHICPRAPIYMDSREALKYVRQSLKQIADLQETPDAKGSASRYGVLKYQFKGASLDIAFHRDPQTLEDMALYGDATISAIAMDRQGHVLCHPKLPEHIDTKTYAIRVTGKDTEISVKRFERRAERFGDFQLLLPDDYAKTL